MTTGTTIGTTEPLRLRHEVKHQLSPQEDLVLTSRLGKLFPRDGHAGPDGSYRVTSLYFDTPTIPPSGRSWTGWTGGRSSACGTTGSARIFSSWRKNLR